MTPSDPGANPAPSPERLFAVTTRSRLQGPWFFPAMMLASLRVRRQLEHSDEVVRWASVVASPTEFWTITVWRSRHDMQEFMRSGAHDEIMWLFSKWLRSFWLMRWRPGPHEVGSWQGLSLAQPEPAPPVVTLEGPKAEALALALSHFPKLLAATGPDGAASFEATPAARRRRAEVGSAGGAIIHIHTSPRRTLTAIAALRRLRRVAKQREGLLRSVIGVGRPGDVYLMGVWNDRVSINGLLTSPEVEAAAVRWGAGWWAGEWLPENEFGHWDGLRLRRQRSNYSIAIPDAARDAAT